MTTNPCSPRGTAKPSTTPSPGFTNTSASPPCSTTPAPNGAICWFKPQATQAIAHVRTLARALNEYDRPVQQLTTDLPGTVLYEDGWQLVAVPHRDRRRRLR